MGILREFRGTFCQSSQPYLWLSYLVFKIIGTVVPKLIFLNIPHIPEGEHRASPTFVSPAKQVRMKSLLMKLLAFSCSAVLYPCGFPSWKSQNSCGSWPPRLELTWPVWLSSKRNFYENITWVFFLTRAFSFVIRAHAKLCLSPFYHSFTILNSFFFYPFKDASFLPWPNSHF